MGNVGEGESFGLKALVVVVRTLYLVLIKSKVIMR